MQTIFHAIESKFIDEFDLPKGVTSLVGGGGKTTLMLRLARELFYDGARVIVSTTTHIFPPDEIMTLTHATAEEAADALAKERLICLGTPTEQGKLSAPDLTVEQMLELAEYVLIEADGAKHLPLKAPAEHEPVLPQETQLVVAVAGLSGIGKQIAETVFRPERYAAICGLNVDGIVTEECIAKALAHPQGQRKSVSEKMRFSVLLNQADDLAAERSALKIAQELQRCSVERTVIASLARYL